MNNIVFAIVVIRKESLFFGFAISYILSSVYLMFDVWQTNLKLISAMKGSREKQGGSGKKLTVKWAPDVYDPIPTSVSHSVKSKKQHKSKNKKSEKKKGKKATYSRGVSSKDKKLFRKSSGTSDKCYNSLDSRSKVIESSIELDAFGANQDSFCGTSFLKNSVTQVHYSVAEAQ